MPTDPEVLARLDFALRAADEAAAVIMRHYSPAGVRFESKPDGTPVTVADVGSEELIRDMISRQFSHDGVLGEECGDTPGTSSYRWVIDPIDGTKSYIHGVPLFGTLIALQKLDAHAGNPGSRNDQWKSVAGVAAFPALNERVYAALGSGAWHIDPSGAKRPARVSATPRLAGATVSVTSPRAMLEPEYRDFYLRLNSAAKLSRGWSDCYGTMLVITGRIDAMLESPMKLWDVAALEPILIEAGGRITDWRGGPTDGSTGAIESNGRIHDELLTMFRLSTPIT